MNLVSIVLELSARRKTLKDEYDKESKKMKTKFDSEDKKLAEILEYAKELNTVCLKCDGKKFIEYAGGYGQHSSTETCDRCNGSGLEPKAQREGRK